ncbi:MAG: AAA family ATPase [Candidatus Coatesbacteria bacterium]|nr:AAA family ATPase [Candidatus Coatesbacteria bacterium]
MGRREKDYWIRQIEIENLAIIKKALIGLTSGLNVIIGETGAGKSLLIKALYYMNTGNFAPSDYREGTEESNIKVWMKNGKNDILLERIFQKAGRNKVEINSRRVAGKDFRDFQKNRWIFLKQHAFTSLFNQNYAMDVIDNIEGSDKLVSYQDEFRNMQKKIDELKKLENEIADFSRREEERSLELKELSEANFHENEKEELKQKLKRLASQDKLFNLSSEAYGRLVDEQNGILDNLHNLIYNIRELSEYDEENFSSFNDSLENALIEIKELSSILKDYRANLIFSPEEQDEMQIRLVFLENLERKYRKNLKELDEYLCDLRMFSEGENFLDKRIEKLKTEISCSKKSLSLIADKISERRKANAVRLKSIIEDELRQLGMPDVIWETGFNQIEESSSTFMERDRIYGLNGCDEIEFWIAPNKGEGLKPLSEVVSGGEMARIVLVLYTVFTGLLEEKIFFMDEIDIGVGGQTAHLIADKLKKMSERYQIICVTHLPQIAQRADNILKVEKTSDGKRTQSKFRILSDNERSQEIANLKGD